MAVVRVKVGIGSKVGIGASSSKDVFKPSKVPLLLHRVLFIIYSKGISK